MEALYETLTKIVTVFMFILSGILITALIRKMLQWKAPHTRRARRKIFDWLDKLFPAPVEETLLCLIILLSTVLIALFPTLGPWAPLTSENQSLNTTSMLGIAAALLALLLFAANQARTAEKDAVSGEEYLGERISTYLFVRSWTTIVLWSPFFHFLTVMLFILPFLQSAIPTTWKTPDLEFLPSLSMKLLIISFWCACLSVIGGVLLLNALNAIRFSMIGLLQPARLRSMIRDEIRHESDQFASKIFKENQAYQQFDVESWVKLHLDWAAKLPKDECDLYFSLVLRSWRLTPLYIKQIVFLERTVSKKGPIYLPQTAQWSHLRNIVKEWAYNRRRNRASEILKCIHKAQLGRLQAMIARLQQPELSPNMRVLLVNQCLQDAKTFDSFFQSLLPRLNPLIDGKPTKKEDPVLRTVNTIILCPENALPWSDRIFSDGSYSPKVEKITAATYQGLAKALFPSRFPKVKSNTYGVNLEKVLASAASLHNNETRSFAMQQLLPPLIDYTIVNRAESELLETTTLKSILSNRGTDFLNFASDKTSNHQSLREITEIYAFNALIGAHRISPTGCEELLKFIQGWRLRGALLFSLFYAHRSYSTLAANDLRPYYSALQRFEEEATHPTDFCDEVTLFLSKSNVSHFVTSENVTWLFDALDKPLTVTLCEEFMKTRITDFELVQFIQWWLIARTPSWYGPRIDVLSTQKSAMDFSYPAEKVLEFAKEWNNVDSTTATSLRILAEVLIKE